MSCPITPVVLTGGDQVTHDGRWWRVPKRDLVSATQVAFEQRQIKVARRLKDARTLLTELRGYQVDVSSGHDTYGNVASLAGHDDLVIALGLATYMCSQGAKRGGRMRFRPRRSSHVGQPSADPPEAPEAESRSASGPRMGRIHIVRHGVPPEYRDPTIVPPDPALPGGRRPTGWVLRRASSRTTTRRAT